MRRLMVVLMLIVILSGGNLPSKSQAERDYFDIDLLDVTYEVDSEKNVVTAHFQMDYFSQLGNIWWIIPVRGTILEVGDLNPAGYKSIIEPDFPVLTHLPFGYCGGLLTTDDVVSEERDIFRDPYRYFAGGIQRTETHLFHPQENIIGFLEGVQHTLSDDAIEAIKSYAAQPDMSFVATKLQPPINHDLVFATISVSYQLDYDGGLELPLQILLADKDAFTLQINVLADERYSPNGFSDVVIDPHDIRVDSAITLNNRKPLESPNSLYSYTGRTNYLTLRAAALADVSSKGFVTELAAPTSEIQFDTHFYWDWNDRRGQFYLPIEYRDEVKSLIQSHPYLTRMYGYISATDALSLPDPEFVSVILPDVSNVLDMSGIDSLELWGCSTRRLEDNHYQSISPHLPTGRDGRFAIPETWQKYDIIYEGIRLILFAPQTVDENTFAAYLRGEQTPPMLMVSRFVNTSHINCDYNLNPDVLRNSGLVRYAQCMGSVNLGIGNATGIAVAILTTPEDFAEHELMYRAMVDFPLTYQYMLHPQLRHSLFLKVDRIAFPEQYIPPIGLSYPDGWIEQMPEPQHVLIMPSEFNESSNAPRAWLYPAGDVTTPIRPNNLGSAKLKPSISMWMVKQFDVNPSDFVEQYMSRCGFSTPLIPFNYDGREGYVGYITDQHPDSQPFIIEISAPESMYSDYEAEFEYIRESMSIGIGCG